jgi:hypothetical protein
MQNAAFRLDVLDRRSSIASGRSGLGKQAHHRRQVACEGADGRCSACLIWGRQLNTHR